MKKALLSIVSIVILTIIMVSISIKSLDPKKIYVQFIQNTKLDNALQDYETISFNALPNPSLTIPLIEEKGKVILKDIKISLSLLSILQFRPQISDVDIGEITIYLNNDDINFANHDIFISELIDKKELSMKAKVNKLIFIESDQDIPIIISDLSLSSSKSQSVLVGNIEEIGNVEASFNKQNDKTLFKMNIKTHDFKAFIEENYKNGVLESGNVAIHTNNLSKTVRNFVTDIEGITNRLSKTEDFSINLDITSSNDFMNFNNIIINSESIKGEGKINLSRRGKYLSNINLDFSQVNLNSNDENLDTEKYDYRKKFDFTNQNAQTKITIKNIKTDNEDYIKNSIIELTTNQGFGDVKEFSGNFVKGGGFKIFGNLSKNKFRSIFNGKIALSHNNFNDFTNFVFGKEYHQKNAEPFSLTSDIKLSLVDLSLQNMSIKTNNNKIDGNISVKSIGFLKRKSANLKLLNANIDNSDIPILGELSQNLKDVANSEDQNYINKFTPIRNINSIDNYSIVFDNLIANNKLYKNISFNLETTPGNISIKHLNIKDNNGWLDLSFKLDGNKIKPTAEIEIHNGNMEADFLSPSSMLDLQKQLSSYVDLEKIDIIFNGYLEKIYQNNLVLENLKFNIKNSENLLEVSTLNVDFFGGRLKSSGSILLKPYTINFVYAMNSVDFDLFNKILFRGIVNSSGVVSANGLLSTNGNNLNELLYNLYSKSDIIGKGLNINNVSIDDFISKVSQLGYDTNYFASDLKNALLTGTTRIQDFKGELELSKGLFTVSPVEFKTKYTSGTAVAKFNLYDLDINLESKFRFYLNSPKYVRNTRQYGSITIDVIANGNLTLPKKSANTVKLQEALIERNKGNLN